MKSEANKVIKLNRKDHGRVIEESIKDFLQRVEDQIPTNQEIFLMLEIRHQCVEKKTEDFHI